MQQLFKAPLEKPLHGWHGMFKISRDQGRDK